MSVRNLVLTVVAAIAVTTVGGCGASQEQNAVHYQEKESDKVSVDTPHNINSYEVELKNGKIVQCVVSEGVYETSIDCDFGGAI